MFERGPHALSPPLACTAVVWRAPPLPAPAPGPRPRAPACLVTAVSLSVSRAQDKHDRTVLLHQLSPEELGHRGGAGYVICAVVNHR